MASLKKFSLSSLLSTTPVQIDELSTDGRRIKRKAAFAMLPSPVKKKKGPSESSETTTDFINDILNNLNNVDEFYYVPDSSKVTNVESLLVAAAMKVRRRYLTSDQPLLEWRAHADSYLAEMIRNEGRGDGDLELCFRCRVKGHDREPLFRCMECFSGDLVCEECCRETHKDRPLDIIERWNGDFFEKIALRDIGVSIQLGHASNETCFNPRTVQDFTVIHTNGIHTIRLSYCNCPNRATAGEWYQQLLRRQWFPSTHLDPQTAATYQCLNMFHVLTLQGKVTTYDFYAGLEKLTDNTGVKNLRDRYRAFSRMMKEWRHLKMAKRAGRGNDAERTLAETRTGEMGIACPACPRPGVNLPNDWEQAPASKKYLYWIYFAIDACFRLKRRLVSSEKNDPDLDSGGSYFTEDSLFRQYLLSVTDQQEHLIMPTPNSPEVMPPQESGWEFALATNSFNETALSTYRKVKGQYANMDYAFASLLRHHSPALTKVISYDIACQWHKNLIQRVKSLPSLVRTDLSLQKLRFAIPKLHIHGHQLTCQLKFSLNWLWGAGRTDGEGVERPWAHLGPIATSTRDMGPGSRHGTMNDHFGHWNWVKMTGLGSLLFKRARTAIEELHVQQESLKEFTEGKGSDTTEWERMIVRWEAEYSKPQNERDPSVVNPYELPKTGLTENDVRLHLTEAEAQEAQRGSLGIHDIGPTAFMSQLLEFEDQQRVLRLDIKENSFATAAQKTELTERRTRMMRLLGRLRAIQTLYMPAASHFLANRHVDNEKIEHVEDIPIVFPSTLSPEDRVSGCRTGLLDTEDQLRDAQLRAALNSLRNHLHIKFRLLTYRRSNVKAQGAITKSQALLKRNQRQIDCDVMKYRDAWRSLEILRGAGKSGWKKLRAGDVRMMGDAEDGPLGMKRKRVGKAKRAQDAARRAARESGVDEGDSDGNSSTESDAEHSHSTKLGHARSQVGEGFRETSWIWKEAGTGKVIDEKVLEEFVRVEWSKTRARVCRWKEEVNLLAEETRRVLVTLEYEAKVWEGRVEYNGPLAEGKDDGHLEGVRAYALSQARVFRSLADNFGKTWKSLSKQAQEDGAGNREEEGMDMEVSSDQEQVEDGMEGASEDEEEQEAVEFGLDDEEMLDDI
ncbi:hypothetical protein F5880DRAFT_1617949 [Lentinula raphanica]|nr:hypothetical protein F5880DRAFT_1617949 [Lentinula raphanica]